MERRPKTAVEGYSMSRIACKISGIAEGRLLSELDYGKDFFLKLMTFTTG